jgi:hypothetical protein
VAFVLALLTVAALAVGASFLTGVLGGGEPDVAVAGQESATAPAGPTAVPTPTAKPTTAPTADPTAEPTASASASTAAPTPSPAGCTDAVVVSAETDQPTYAAGEEPVLSLVVRNEGGEACEVNLGTSQMEFVLTRDDERIFSSVDCQADSQDLERTLEAGGEERATFDWARNRTVPECTVVEEEPEPGEYTLTTRLGARSSTPVEFTLQ